MLHYTVIIPTYNNAQTLHDVVCRTLDGGHPVIVVNDGSTDSTQQILDSLSDRITVISYTGNRGKGYAIKRGLRLARQKGYAYAVTIDSDGQHRPEEIKKILFAAEEAIKAGPDRSLLIVGSRDIAADGMPHKNTFANRFSNFWFRLQTLRSLPDTQSGFRLYQLDALPSLGIITNRYESELALLVFSAWRGVKLLHTPVTVYYPPAEQRVSHFRPFTDFLRISLLNTILTFAALFYGYPSMLVHHIINNTKS